MLVMSFAMHFAGLLGAPRRTSEVAYMGTGVANSWQPYMIAVAAGTLFANEKTHSMDAVFAEPAPGTEQAPAALQSLFRWAAVGLIVAILAYAGPLLELLSHPGFSVPGMRTW